MALENSSLLLLSGAIYFENKESVKAFLAASHIDVPESDGVTLTPKRSLESTKAEKYDPTESSKEKKVDIKRSASTTNKGEDKRKKTEKKDEVKRGDKETAGMITKALEGVTMKDEKEDKEEEEEKGKDEDEKEKEADKNDDNVDDDYDKCSISGEIYFCV